MNKGALDRGRFEAIEAYVLGTMRASDRERFEQDMATDPALRREVELQRENTLAIELGGMDRLLKEVRNEQHGTAMTGGNAWMTYLKYAAAIALLIAGALWWMNKPATHESLFAEHFVPDPGLPVAMSATDDHAFHDAMVAYKLGDHIEAIDKWNTLLLASPGNDTLRYFIASAALAQGDVETAVPLLQELSADGASSFHSKSRWYLFLAHLKAGDVASMRTIGLQDDPLYGERVRSILATMDQ